MSYYVPVVFFRKKQTFKMFFLFVCRFADTSQWSEHLEGDQTDANTDLETLNKAEGGQREGVALVTIGEVLTASQLVVRRGLAVFFMLLIFAAGIVLNEMPTYFLRAINNTIIN